MFKYQLSDRYGEKYKIKKEKIDCFSKSEMEDMYPDKNYNVLGETIFKNKKEKIDTIELGRRTLIVSKEGGHSKLFFKTAGYIEEADGDYIILLKRRWILLWILLGLLIAASGAASVLFLTGKPEVVAPPDTTKVETDTVLISIPYGNVDYRMVNDVTKFDGYDMKLYMTHDGKEDAIHKQKVKLEENGDIQDGTFDFMSLHFELAPGDYEGRMVYTKPGCENQELPAKVLVRSSESVKMSFGYSDQITVDKASENISLYYELGEDVTHDIMIQLILVQGNKEYLLSESGTVRGGDKINEMKLDKTAAKQISSGSYDGFIRMYVVNGNDVTASTSTDTEAHITVN